MAAAADASGASSSDTEVDPFESDESTLLRHEVKQRYRKSFKKSHRSKCIISSSRPCQAEILVNGEPIQIDGAYEALDAYMAMGDVRRLDVCITGTEEADCRARAFAYAAMAILNASATGGSARAPLEKLKLDVVVQPSFVLPLMIAADTITVFNCKRASFVRQVETWSHFAALGAMLQLRELTYNEAVMPAASAPEPRSLTKDDVVALLTNALNGRALTKLRLEKIRRITGGDVADVVNALAARAGRLSLKVKLCSDVDAETFVASLGDDACLAIWKLDLTTDSGGSARCGQLASLQWLTALKVRHGRQSARLADVETLLGRLRHRIYARNGQAVADSRRWFKLGIRCAYPAALIASLQQRGCISSAVEVAAKRNTRKPDCAWECSLAAPGGGDGANFRLKFELR